MRKRYILVVGAVLASAVAYGVTSWSMAAKEQPKVSTFADIDQFKANLGQRLSAGNEVSVSAAAQELAGFRLEGGLAVCSNRAEIESKQYIELAEMLNQLARFTGITQELNGLLDSDLGVTDCQFRITEVLAKHAQR